MSLTTALEELRQAGIPAALRQFGSLLDALWVEDALAKGAPATAKVRRRKLPRATVVWLVIAMGLFRDAAIRTVVTHLGLVLPGGKKAKKQGSKTVAASSVAEGRQRLGEESMAMIFRRSAQAWSEPAADADRWRGLSLWGVDGSTLNVEDTEDNENAFGRPSSGGRDRSGYPQVRIVALLGVRSHLLRSAAFGPCKGKETGEQTLARELWNDLPDDALVIMDRNFINYGALFRLTHDDKGRERLRHWLVRAKSNLRWETVRRLGPGDELVELSLSPQSRRDDPGLPQVMLARAIRYQIKGFRPQILLTSLLDAQAYPAEEIIPIYHERWETELGYDELKTNLLEQKEALRSRTAAGVRQELWGILLAYNLVRRKMLDVAERVDLPPTRISFKNSLLLIRGFCYAHALVTAPGALPEAIEQLEAMLSVLVLPERRPERQYARQVKIKMSNYKRNKGRPQRPTETTAR
jgi:hypothetical protein